MAAVFTPATGTAQVWGINETIQPVQIPFPTGLSGDVSYETSGLPEGLTFNAITLVIYGAPVEAGSGTFTLTATDDDGASEWTLEWSVAAYVPQMEVARYDDLQVLIGQAIDYQLPVPAGGVPPYTYSIVAPGYAGNWPYDPRLPQGISFQDGAFTGTATDTQDNEGRLWYNNVSTVNRGVEGNPVTRLRPVWNLPLRLENRFFDYSNSRYDLDAVLSRTRPMSEVAYGPDVPPGGLRFRTTSPSGHGRLDNRTDPPFANPFIRITSVSHPARQATFYVSEVTTAPRDAWQFFFSPTYPVVAPWLDSQANTGDQFRLEVGTASVYPLTIRVSDSVGSSIEQTIQVRLSSAPAGAPSVPTIQNAVVSAHSADVSLAPVAGVSSEYALERGRNQPTTWTAFTGSRLLIPRLATNSRYNLWIRHRNQAGAGPAVFLEVQTLSVAGIIQAPAPLGLSLDNNAGDQRGILDGALRGRWQTADITTQVLGYDYQLTTADRPLTEDGWQAMPASTSSTSVFTWYGLRNGTAYRLGVRARNDAGPGRHSEITGTPEAGRPDTEYSRWQLQIMMDLSGLNDDPRGAPWYDLASRCLEVYVRYGREARQQLTATGTCAFLLETSDDFINVEGTSLYRLDDLQNRIVHINEVLETSGGLRRKTRFAGLVETATFQPSAQRSVIQVTAVDMFGLMAQDTAVFGQDLPAQTTGERIKLLLDTAGWEPNGTGTRAYNPELIDEGSKTCARIPVAIGESLEVNLLDELNLLGQSEGGRVFISGGGDNLPGSVTFQGASPVTLYDGRISDQLSADPATIEMDGQPEIQSEDSFLYNDFELSYPGGDQPERIPPNAMSVAIWGKRTYDLYTEVRTDQESTRALLRQLRKQYGTPRRWISSLPVKAHFQTETAARLLQDLDLSKSLLVHHRPPGARETITGLQRIDYVEIILYWPG